jgi:regulatory protein YycI of two-component signal transduction system YycFG
MATEIQPFAYTNTKALFIIIIIIIIIIITVIEFSLGDSSPPDKKKE